MLNITDSVITIVMIFFNIIIFPFFIVYKCREFQTGIFSLKMPVFLFRNIYFNNFFLSLFMSNQNRPLFIKMYFSDSC